MRLVKPLGKAILLFIFLAGPSIFSACTRCGSQSYHHKYQIQSLSIVNSAGTAIDSVFVKDSTYMILKWETVRIASSWPFRFDAGTLMACKPVMENSLSPGLDSVQLVSADSISSAYPVGMALNKIAFCNDFGGGEQSFEKLNQQQRFSYTSATDYYRFRILNKLPVSKLKVKILLWMKNGSKIGSQTFTVRF
jgi:hypothetical protein